MPESDALSDALEQAVSETARVVGAKRPRWWRLVGALQWLLALAALGGFIWLGALFAVAWLQLPDPPTVDVGPIPLPTALLIAGAGLGWLVAALASLLARRGAKRAGRRVRREAIRRVEAATRELIVAPVERELAERSRLASLVRVAAGG